MFGSKKALTLGEKEDGSVWPQCIAAVIASLTYTSSGIVLAWTSPTLPSLEKSHYIELTEEDESWISALVSVGAAIGPLCAGLAAVWLGHRVTLMCTAGLYLIGWATVAAARSAGVLYVARFALGFAIGTTYTISPTYVNEISQVEVRGALGSMAQFFSSAGLLYAYVVGPWTSYVILAIASGAIPAMLLVGLFFIPDSPYQLLRRGKKDEARNAFLWLRGKSELEKNGELQDIEDEVAEVMKQKTSMKDLIANRANMKALLLSQGLVAFQQLCGINAVVLFTQKIMRLGISSLDPSVAAIIVGAVMLMASTITPALVERTGRKALLLGSAAGMCVSQVVLGLFFYFSNIGTDTSDYAFVPILSLVVYVIVYSVGFGPLPWTVSAELFAPIVRSKAASLTAYTCWVFSFMITFFFQNVLDMFGSHTVFWAFATFCAAGGIFVYALLPETKGKTLREIQVLLGGHHSSCSDLEGGVEGSKHSGKPHKQQATV